MCSDSEKNMSAFADQNHAPSLTCVRLELSGRRLPCVRKKLKIKKALKREDARQRAAWQL